MTALSTAEAALRRAPDDPGVPVTVSGAEAAALVAELDRLRESRACAHPRVTRRLDGGLRCERCRAVIGHMSAADVPGRVELDRLRAVGDEMTTAVEHCVQQQLIRPSELGWTPIARLTKAAEQWKAVRDA